MSAALDRDAVRRLLDDFGGEVYHESGMSQESLDHTVDAVMELAVPVPTREQIAKALHDDIEVHPWLSESCIDHRCGKDYDRLAAVVLALSTKEGQR
jgi:hypothetical protein